MIPVIAEHAAELAQFCRREQSSGSTCSARPSRIHASGARSRRRGHRCMKLETRLRQTWCG